MPDDNPQHIPPITKEEGKVEKTLLNIVTMFLLDENLKGLFHYNEFSGRVEYARKAVWHNIPIGKRLDDNDITYIRYYFSHNKRLQIGKEDIRDAIIELSARHTIHPVRSYLKALKWDSQSRLNNWLLNTCGVRDDMYSQEVGRKWILAAVARIFEPGIKFDNVLVLEGDENIGKSLVLRTLGKPWFTDSVSLLQKEPDIVAKMVGRWIIELAEMKGLRKQEQEFVKAFISTQTDEQRLSYRRDPQEYNRQSVFAGTSNNMAYLLDENGNRRFWPVWCNKINIKWLRDNREQLFAEAVHIVKTPPGIYSEDNEDGEKLFLEGECFKLAQAEQKKRLNTDEVLETSIENYLIGKTEVTMKEIMIEHLRYELKDLNNRSQIIAIGRILKKLGFEKKHREAIDGSRFKYYRELIVPMNAELKPDGEGGWVVEKNKPAQGEWTE